MPDFILDIDTWLFLKLNAGAANAFFDWLMPLLTDVRRQIWLIAPALVALAVFGGGKGRSVVLAALILIAITDQVSSHLLKPLIARPRPCHGVEGARVIYHCGKTFAFPSGHATNSMGAAIFFGLIYRRWIWALLAFALVNSYSRIYLGVHYPLDILGGWVLGGALAWGWVWFTRRYWLPLLGRWRVFRPNGAWARPTEPSRQEGADVR